MSRFLNGEQASALAAQAFSEQVYTSQKQFNNTNVWGQTIKVKVQVGSDPTSYLAQAASERILASALVSSSNLIGAIPHLYKLSHVGGAGTVIHVSAEKDTKSSSFADFSNVMAVRQSGLALLTSSTVQEAYDLALIAHVASVRSKTAFLHFFDSKRVAHEYTNVDTVSVETLNKFFSLEQVEEFKSSVIDQNQQSTAYLKYQQQQQQEEKVDVATIVQQTMDEFGTLTGRRYTNAGYVGHAEAEQVIVAMGAGASVVEHVVKSLKQKVGLLKIHLYRPLDDLVDLVPKSVKRLIVLEPSQDLTSTWNPLFLDIAAGFIQHDHIDFSSGQYGVTANDVSPSSIHGVFAAAEKSLPRRFVVDNKDVITPVATSGVVAANVHQLVVVGNEQLAHSFAQEFVSQQVYTLGSVSHVRVSSVKQTGLIPSLIDDAQVVVLLGGDDSDAIQAVGRLHQNGIVVVSSVDGLRNGVKRAIADKQASVAIYQQDVSLLDQKHIVKVPLPEWSTLPQDAVISTTTTTSVPTPVVDVSAVETPYIKMLGQAFGDRLDIVNAVNTSSVWGPNVNQPEASTPEYGYGKVLYNVQQRARFIESVEKLVKSASLSVDHQKALSQWLLVVKSPSSKVSQINTAADAVITAFGDDGLSGLVSVGDVKDHLYVKSNWLIGSDTWAYDLGQSGVHHVIAGGENVNMLIVDTQNYSSTVERDQRKKDIGLYAMNFGNVYVASVAVYSSYTGVLHALMEADAYQGPSIVLAYLPTVDNQVDPIASLKETKICVDNGSWPLYRWNPALDAQGKEPFSLDSQRIKKDLEKFLERENHFSQIVAQHPDLNKILVSSLESDVKQRHDELKRKARDDYAKLLSGLGGANGPPLTVLFGSDNGNAEGVAKKIATRAKSRGLKVKLMAMDDYADIQELGGETNLVIVCSTAGQGELPSNGREFWKALNGLNAGEIHLADLSYTIFGMGDSHYWPREEDAMFYNRPGKLLDAKLELLGANRLVELGLGDDQDADGFETGLSVWEPLMWKALGVKDVGADDDEPKLTDDQMKINSNYLRGTIAEDLRDESTGAISEINGKLLKFHGSYGQDDRDIREERKKQGLEKAYSFMIRVRMPGGVSTPEQWLVMDKLADDYANGAIKLTTRQAFQLHGILKKNLRSTIRGINHSLLSTLAACGDVNRNIMVTPVTEIPEVHEQVQQFSNEMMLHLAPKTSAYHEIWLADELVAGHAVQDYEPIYGPTYLPRKFKIVVAVPPNNDVDIYAHDLGFIAIVEGKKVVGYNVTVGGGMGMTHGNKKTYPRPATMFGYIPAEAAIKVSEAVMTTQRDYGDRTNRKHARLKYTIDDHGVEFFKSEVEKRSGYTFEPARAFEFKDNADRYGWTKGVGDKWHFCMFVENGKIKDFPDFQVRTGLRELAKWHKGEFRLSPNQHLVIANVPEADLEKTKQHLIKYKMDNLSFTGLRLNAMACVALPTCGLAMAESERYLPTLVGHLEHAIEEAGLHDDAITIRMTGCPNGCARPYLAELAFVGKAPGTYNVYLGGGHQGQRLNKLFKESLREEEILATVKPIIKQYALERQQDEPFGDWVIRAGYVKKTITGKDFHDL
ncbi:thiamine diphosphate-binding protein [Halteromyces radiatus]|uniref:thiamine diphosphate-binding protein n=1 Tax=Halteromyces radiatus TaxID=101107 RepID=UPI00221EFD1B|nr:thiamine diphosphate-binding protein [Halteromyces radiatus]KAI8097648.1 thiamine diphosphate-binding protein [Halteromyces radiatus]